MFRVWISRVLNKSAVRSDCVFGRPSSTQIWKSAPKEIRRRGFARQVREYRELVERHREEVAKSYHAVAKNLVEIAGWVSPRREVGQLVQQVAGGAPFEIDTPPVVGLVIYGFDSDQKESKRWEAHFGKLKTATLMPLQCAGDPKNIRRVPGTCGKS